MHKKISSIPPLQIHTAHDASIHNHNKTTYSILSSQATNNPTILVIANILHKLGICNNLSNIDGSTAVTSFNASAAASTSDVDVEERSILDDDDDNEWCSSKISSSGSACNLDVEAEEEGVCLCICICICEAEDKDVVGGVNAVQKITLLQIIATIQLAIIRRVMATEFLILIRRCYVIAIACSAAQVR